VASYLGHIKGNKQIGEDALFQDPDAAYNSMFYYLRNVAGGSTGYFSNAGVVTGPSTGFLLAFQNGTSFNVSTFATPTVSFSNISTGAELFSAVESKQIAANPDQTTIATSITLTHGYPEPVIEHPQGFVAGYFLNTTNYTDIAVLALPTFLPGTIESTQEYQSVVQKFLAACTNAGKTKLIIDLSGNPGGDPYVAVE
jgi:Peptidase family S41